MKFFSRLCLLLVCGVFIHAASAEQLNGLYEVVVPVESQSSSDLRKATASGLKIVFVRVSGRTDAAVYEEVQLALGTAQIYLKQYSYKRERNTEDGSEQLKLMLEFEQEQVDKQLRVAGLPLWSGNRPSILVWLVVDDSGGRRIVGEETSPDGVAAIQYHAERRGLPIDLPLLDLEDNIAISADELWSLNSGQAQQASSRYQSDTLLIGKASQLSSGLWLGAWRFSFEGQSVEFEIEARDIESFVGLAIDRVAELLARQYAIAPVSIAQDGILMRLGGIHNFTDYTAAVNYLEGLAAIRHANVVSIEGEEIILRLVAEGQLEQLELAIARDKLLLPAEVDLLAVDAVLLNYLWPGSTGLKSTDGGLNSER